MEVYPQIPIWLQSLIALAGIIDIWAIVKYLINLKAHKNKATSHAKEAAAEAELKSLDALEKRLEIMGKTIVEQEVKLASNADLISKQREIILNQQEELTKAGLQIAELTTKLDSAEKKIEGLTALLNDRCRVK